MKLFPKLLLWAAMSLLVVAGAKAQEREAWRGIFCDTEIQTRAVVTEGIKLGGALQGIRAVNLEAGEQACIYGSIIGIKGEPVSTINSPDGELDVVPWQVLAVPSPIGLLELETPKVWFTLAASKSRGV